MVGFLRRGLSLIAGGKDSIPAHFSVGVLAQPSPTIALVTAREHRTNKSWSTIESESHPGFFPMYWPTRDFTSSRPLSDGLSGFRNFASTLGQGAQKCRLFPSLSGQILHRRVVYTHLLTIFFGNLASWSNPTCHCFPICEKRCNPNFPWLKFRRLS
jgi:hypothetical protein